ncbi:MAG: ABC transporter ATP-binding protein [Gammaproteobacteria bacterium]|nr:ABC transporter ATP-binding protein [Gammaproteobacteria bacterium]
MLLEVKNLCTRLQTGDDAIDAVQGVSFSIERGETFCLVGESGSGKSVTALSIMQLLPADISSHPGGEILFEHRHANSQQREQVDILQAGSDTLQQIRGARIAMIFQEPMTSLNPVFTIGDQIIEALLLHWPDMSETEARKRAIEALRQVQIPHPEQRIDEYPHRLSGGQRQRAMIAMAMACEPDLLIADEPTTALDVTVQAEILRLMKNLQEKNGMGILFITHDFGVVAQMGHRLAVMKEGRIVETGETRQMIRQPTHDYTRRLLGSLPENLVKPARQHTPEPRTVIQVEGLNVHFPIKKGLLRRTVDSIRAVDGVDMNIQAGQIMALVGESGCGKTTLGRAILRLTEPTSGSVKFLNTDITRLTRKAMQPYRRQMQVVFQDPMSSLNPRLTIASALTEPMGVHGIGMNREERLERAGEVLEQVQLRRDYLWRYPHQFSGGQRQRIGIARALCLDPSFIICDEITSALDVSVQAEILQLLLALRDERELALLFITHNIGVVEYLSDDMAVMHEGRIVERGKTAELIRNPSQDYTQRLLDAVPRIS